MYKVVLLRHGESTWNKENRFTGWTDVDLSERGREEARAAGIQLKQDGYSFDLAFTSVLTRAIRTCSPRTGWPTTSKWPASSCWSKALACWRRSARSR